MGSARHESEDVVPDRTLLSGAWFPNAPAIDGSADVRSIVTRTAVGLAIGAGLVLLSPHRIMGFVVLIVSALLGAASLASRRLRKLVEAALTRLGHALAQAVSWIVLPATYLLGFSAARAWLYLTRADPLQLRPSTLPSHWLAADRPERKIRFIATMFVSERAERRGLTGRAVLGLAIILLATAEGLLRLWGFGNPVLYISDAQAGYYPASHQSIGRYRGRIDINAYGMRSPDFSVPKPSGTFRILMIGDSTLYGGSYIDQSQLYSRLLERSLRTIAAGRSVEVLAIGVNAWGPFNELGYLREFGTFGADLVVVALPIVDIHRPLTRLDAVPFFRAANPPRSALQEMLAHLAWRVRADMVGPQDKAELAWNSRQGVAAYGELAHFLREHGAEVMFEVLPSRAAGTGEQAPVDEARDVQRLRTALPSFAGLRYPVGLFRSASGPIYHDGAHLDVAGHLLYAAFLRDEITGNSAAWRAWLTASAPRS